MASAVYPIYLQEVIQGTSNTSLGGTVKIIGVTSGYTYNSAHNFHDDLSNTVGTAQTLGSKTFTNGVFDAANATFTAVAGGSTINAFVIYVDTGSSATSRLVAYIDGFTPIATNGGDIVVNFDAAGIISF